MTYLRHPENIKVCPECGTNLMSTARRCAVCGYQFEDAGLEPVKKGGRSYERHRLTPPGINLPILLGFAALLLAANFLVIFGLQKRGELRTLAAGERATAAYLATIYQSPTPLPTATFTPGPPTLTPVVDIQYEVLPGDSCLSIADRFDIYLDALLLKNDIDCANLQIGTVLRIPHPTPSPEIKSTAEGTSVP